MRQARATGSTSRLNGGGGATLLSTFSGIGGMDLGLEKAGFVALGCIEIDPIARASLRLNRPDWPQLEPGDIAEVARSLRPNDLGLDSGDLDLLAGGPPCQPFSKAAQWSPTGRAGHGDARSRCIFGYLQLVGRFLPKAILIENVPGYANGRQSMLHVLEAGLAAINKRHGTHYRLQHRILNAADVGVPQRRQRAILVALRDGGAFLWPEPTHLSRPTRAWDAIGTLSLSDPPQMRGRYAQLLAAIPEGKNYQYFTSEGDGTPKLFGYRTRYWSFLLKLAKEEPAWTLAAHPGPSTGPFHWENRPLAPAEMLRIQSFPASWRVEGDYRSQVRQVGNATPPLLAEVLGRALGAQLFGLLYNGRPKLTIPRTRRVPPAERPIPVPRRLRSLAGDHPAHPGTGRGPRPASAP